MSGHKDEATRGAKVYGEETPYIADDGSSVTKAERASYWEAAKGLQEVDYLKTSSYLDELSDGHVNGIYTTKQVSDLLDAHYEGSRNGQATADIVAARIEALLETRTFSFRPHMLLHIHGKLFDGVLPQEWVGKWRAENIGKPEEVLRGESVRYSAYELIPDTLEYEFRNADLSKSRSPLDAEGISSIARFIGGIWQIHPFREGNTRTAAVFLEMWMNGIGLDVDNTTFARHSRLFRDSLVRANYTNLGAGVVEDWGYLEKFLSCALLGECEELDSLDLHI